MRPKDQQSELVNKSICRCVPKLARFFEDKAKAIYDQMLGIILNGKKE